ncbi:hypothetical protein M9H77_04240 [Catharanthus roseus]|uniref:Uncharacterized protein n=1 Tax=Catharanthus roseus TaxID=4058 RepID=A0ACC0CDS0_CATRO|nr:hypothetical protein M9H77_04240 [Catharanthus roseus]
MRNNQWGYGNFSPHSRTYENKSYDFYESNGARDCYNDISCKGVPRNEVRNGINYLNTDRRFHKRIDDYEGYYDSYNYRGYNCGRSSQILGTTSRPLSYKNVKLSLLCRTFGPYDYEAWDPNVESFFYSFCVREEEKLQLVLKFLSYELNVWWDSKCENGRRMGAQPIKTWSLMKQSLRNKFGVENHERQRQANKLSPASHVIDRKVIHHEKKNTCTFVKKEKSREGKVKSIMCTKESEGKIKESEYLIENHESLKEEQVEEKQDEVEKSEERKEEMSLMIFEGDKREEMREIQHQFLNFLTTTCGKNSNHGKKAIGEGMGKELSMGYEDTSISLSLNPFLLCHEFMWLLFCGKAMNGYVVNSLALQMVGYQVKIIMDWPTSKKIFEVDRFHRITSFDKRFIKDPSIVASSLTVVTKKMNGFTWESCSLHLEFSYTPTIL